MPLQQIVTPDWLISTYLFGIDLTNDQNEPYPDELWIHSIDSAISMAEAQFDVTLRANRRLRHVQRYDTVDWQSTSWNLINVHNRPITRVNSIAVRYGSREPSVFPTGWIHIASKLAGQIQIIPDQEGFGGFSYSFGMPWPGVGSQWHQYLPGWFEIDYETGWESRLKGAVTVGKAGASTVTLGPGVDDDGVATTPEAASDLRVGYWLAFDDRPERVYRVKRINSDTEVVLWEALEGDVDGSNVTVMSYDPQLVDFVGLVASLLPLDTAGDLIIGAGISSQSLSMDGLSQSISTTSGVENSGYGARAVQYGKRIESITKQLTRHYRPMNIAVT
jgi:hypothetical protein